MNTVGEFFRHVRETKGLTLDAVASKTCIHPDFLQALEENNFAVLPDQVFAKGFVRSYARSLGLDENDAMRRFVESAGPFYEKQGERERLRQKQAEDEQKRKTSRQVVAGATVVGLLALVLLLTREQSAVSPTHRASPGPPVSGGTLPPPALPRPSPLPPAQPENLNPSPIGSTEPSGSAPAPGSTPTEDVRQDAVGAPAPMAGSLAQDPVSSTDSSLQLDLEAFDMTWVLVRVDGGPAQEVLLRPGDRVRWKGADQFALTLGNAGGVRVVLNGKEQGPFGPRGKVARDIVLKR